MAQKVKHTMHHSVPGQHNSEPLQYSKGQHPMDPIRPSQSHAESIQHSPQVSYPAQATPSVSQSQTSKEVDN